MDAVVDFKSEALDRIGRRIDAAWKRINSEWIEGSLELMQALGEARQRFSANKAFGTWLKENCHDHVSHQDRAALIGMASDMKLARDILTKTERRSYQLIWNEVKVRFTNVSKSDKPKRGRRKGIRKSKPRQTDPVKDTIIAEADQGKTSAEIGAEIGIDGRAVRHELEREQIRRETLNSLLDAAAAKNFTEKGTVKIEDAIRIHKVRLNKAFEQQVNEEVRKRIAAADDAARKQNKELREENTRITVMLNQRGVFTERQFSQLLMCVHPDNTASVAIRNEMLQLLVANKRRLVKN